MTKLMISIREENFRLLTDEAKDRGITIQELIRAVIVPDWVRTSDGIRREDSMHRAVGEMPEQGLPPIFSRPRLGKSSRVR